MDGILHVFTTKKSPYRKVETHAHTHTNDIKQGMIKIPLAQIPLNGLLMRNIFIFWL